MSQNLPVNNFEWIKDSSRFNEDFRKNYNEESDEGYFLQVDFQYLERLYELHIDLPFYQKECKLKKSQSFWVIYMIKMDRFYT